MRLFPCADLQRGATPMAGLFSSAFVLFLSFRSLFSTLARLRANRLAQCSCHTSAFSRDNLSYHRSQQRCHSSLCLVTASLRDPTLTPCPHCRLLRCRGGGGGGTGRGGEEGSFLCSACSLLLLVWQLAGPHDLKTKLQTSMRMMQ